MPMLNITGKTIGSCVINEYLILFTTDSSSDRIYKIKPPNSSGISDVVKLAELNLGFNENNLIQTLPFYENESIQKVYWVDGLNQPRVINIAIEDGRIFDYVNTSFDFVQNLELNETCQITKLYDTGLFKSGVIQYGATYFNKNGAESNLFWISDINYISMDDRAGKPDEIVRNAFKINLSNLDEKFDYVRIYSIYRTSIDTTPELKSVVDLKIPTSKSITYIDGGTSSSIISTDFLLYVGGEELIPQCISQKNNTLFLGNITLPDNVVIPPTLQTYGDEIIATGVPIHNSTFSWETNEVDFEGLSQPTGNSMYPYIPFKSNVRHFKFDETYRLGLQGQFPNGKWSNPIWLGYDNKVDKRYSTRYGSTGQVKLSYVTGKYSLAQNLVQWMSKPKINGGLGFSKIRPVMVPLSYSDRTIIAQGIVNNTLGNMSNRFGTNKSNLPFSYPDYLFRTNGKRRTTYLDSDAYNGQYAHFDLLKLNNNLRPSGSGPNEWIEIMGNGDTWDYHDVNHNGTPPPTPIGGDSPGVHTTPFGGDFDRDFFFIDRNIVNFWSPDLINNTEQLNSYVKNIQSVGLYGFAFQTALNSKFEIDFGDRPDTSGSGPLSDSKGNYYSNEDYISVDNYKRLFPYFKGVPSDGGDEEHRSWHNIPIWSPEKYKIHLPSRDGSNTGDDYQDETIEIDFTKINKSGYNYFGINRTLNLPGSSESIYKYNINNPYLVFNDSTIFYESNLADNTLNNGNILYSKNVEKNYPSNTYFNTFKYGTGVWGLNAGLKYSDDLTWYKFEGAPQDPIDEAVNSGLAIKYNTNTHAIFSFGLKNGLFSCMPRLRNTSLVGASTYEDFSNPVDTNWYRSGSANFRTDIIGRNYLNDAMLDSDKTSVNTLPIFDLYSNVTSDTRYGGLTADALYSNTWIPCGDSIKINDSAVDLKYTIGDTFITRFDMLRVFPNDILQIPQHTEIVSFICESFTNSDGRSDVNRYNTDSSLMTTGNYGLFNSVYSQKNNYFNYNILDPLLFNTTRFSNSIVWSKTKVSGSINDTWTDINMLSSIDLDGVYGEVSSINLFNNDLYAFQPKGIARLLFNERVQQQASDGVSVELTNGYKVPEYRYLTNQYGCNNKWSIIEGKQGIYFIDYINKSLISIGDGIKDLGLSLGFKSWFNENTDGRNYTLSYDRINNDLYIHDETDCLNYSETLGSFVSFFDYINVPRMRNVWDNFVSLSYSNTQGNVSQLLSESNLNTIGDEIGDNIVSEDSDLNRTSIWLHNKGEYNMFYGNQKPFSVEYLLNPDPLNDKVFNTFEYRLNDQLIDWNNVVVSNWYQVGELNSGQFKANMKRKFNVNRVQLPRQSNTLNRIRSTWSRLKISHEVTEVNSNNKFDMQELNITYTI